MKRILSFCIALLMAASLVTIPALAEGSVAFAAETVEAIPGGTVDVPVTVNGSNFELHTLDMTVEYDADALTLNGVTKGSALENASIEALDDTVPGEVGLSMLYAESGLTGKAELFTLHFTVNESASAAEAVKITVNEAARLTASGSFTAVANTVSDGAVVVRTDSAVKAEAGSLNEALNVSGGSLEFTSTGDYAWVVENDYAKSGNYNKRGTKSELTVKVPENLAGKQVSLSFRYRGSSNFRDYFRVIVDGKDNEPLLEAYEEFAPGWIRATFDLGTDAKEIKFVYEKSSEGYTAGEFEDTAYLDEVAITEVKPLEGLEITSTEITVKAGKKTQVDWNTVPAGALYKEISFSQSSWANVNVKQNGIIEGKAAHQNGASTTITMTITDDDDKTYSKDFTVTVIDAEAVELKLDLTTLTIPVTGSRSDGVFVTVDEDYTGKLEWESENPDVARVSTNQYINEYLCMITGVSKGETKVTVSTEDGKSTATCEVKVVDDAQFLAKSLVSKFQQKADFDTLSKGIDAGIGRDFGGLQMLVEREPDTVVYTYAYAVEYTAKENESVRFKTDFGEGSKKVDTFITLFDKDFNILQYNDNDERAGENANVLSSIEYTFGTAGTYYIIVSQAQTAIMNAVSNQKCRLIAEKIDPVDNTPVQSTAPTTKEPDAPATANPTSVPPTGDNVTIELQVNGNMQEGEAGFQLLLDATHNLCESGVLDPHSDKLCDTPQAADIYAKFGTTIPANAKDDVTKNMVLSPNTVSIQVPAGTYDLAIVEPFDSYVKLLKSSVDPIDDSLTFPSVLDNFVFEKGRVYKFYVYYAPLAMGDAIDLYIDGVRVDYDPNGQQSQPENPTANPTATPKPQPKPEDVVFTVDGPDGAVKAGDEFTVDIAISGHAYEANILAFTLKFDPNTFDAVDAKLNTDFILHLAELGSMHDHQISDGRYVLGAAADRPFTYQGVVCTLTFKVLSNAADGDYNFTLDVTDLMYDDGNGTERDIARFINDATVSVGDAPAPSTMATIILKADKHPYNSGFQMLIDKNAAVGPLPGDYSGLFGYDTDGDFTARYGEFEYRIPQGIVGNAATDATVVNSSASIQIPAGTYNYAIVSPQYYDGTEYGDTAEWDVYLVSEYGSCFGYAENFTFEAGKTYVFNVRIDYKDTGADIVDLYIDDVLSQKPTEQAPDIENGWSFESDPFTEEYGWTVRSDDNDDYNWRWLSKSVWQGIQMPMCDGYGMMASECLVLTERDLEVVSPDNWLISPKFTAGTELDFYAANFDIFGGSETLAVYISVNGGDAEKLREFTIYSGEFEIYRIDTTEYAGESVQVLFRHYGENFSTLMIDSVQYKTGSTSTPTPPPAGVPGDANGDGKVEMNDALKVMRDAIDLETLSAEAAKLCDMNKNGGIDVEDALAVARIAMGLTK